MKRFRRILVGVDLTLEGDAVTVGSRRAALQAQWLATRSGAELTLFHSTWADLYEENALLRHGLSPEGTAALEALTEDYRKASVPVELVLSDGRSWVEMIRRCNRGENDLVVVARRNDPDAGGALGSVSRKLMRKCPAPVWVLKPDAPLVHERVMAATDLTPVGDLAVELAASIAGMYECTLDVVHAWQVPLDVQMSASFAADRVDETLARLHEEAVAHIREHLERVAPGMHADLHVGRDAPSRAIAEGVDRLHPDLLVMGTVSRGGLAGLLVGNTAERILDRVGCSLLTIKPGDFVSPVE